MKISSDIVIYIVEDDQAQAQILNDKLLEYNPEYNIIQFKNGNDLMNHLNNGYAKNKYNYLILDYYLQTSENSSTLTGIEVIKLLGETNPKVKIILFSAYENDDDAHFKDLKQEHNVIDIVRKTDYAYSQIQNIFRFDYAENSLKKKKRRFQLALAVFIAILSLSALHFIYTYFSF